MDYKYIKIFFIVKMFLIIIFLIFILQELNIYNNIHLYLKDCATPHKIKISMDYRF